jgi:hypothetical protein
MDNQYMCEGGFTLKVTTLGLDVAKSIFQLHGVDEARQSHRPEACAPEQAPGDGRAACYLGDWDGGVVGVRSTGRGSFNS